MPWTEVSGTLGPGECFGEMSLLRAQRAVASVRTTRPSTVLVLARHYFERLTAALPEVRAMFEQMSEDRVQSARAGDEPTDEGLF